MRAPFAIFLALAAPGVARGGITVSTSTSGTYVSSSIGAGGSGGFTDVFMTPATIDEGSNDDVVALSFSPAENGCTTSGGTGLWTFSGIGGVPPWSGAVYSPASNDSGLVTITCQSGASYAFRVGNHHRRLYMLSPTLNLWLGSGGIRDEFNSRGTSDSHYDQPSGRVPAYTSTDHWVQGTAWDYILNEGLPDLRAGGSNWASLAELGLSPRCTSAAYAPFERDVNGGGIDVTDSGDTDRCPDSGDTYGLLDTATAPGDINGDLRQYRTWLERLAIAAMLDDTSTNGGLNSNAYHDTLVFWTNALVNTSNWEANLSDDDLVRADLIIGLAVAYDWAYPDLDMTTRRAWRAKLYDEASALHADWELTWECAVTATATTSCPDDWDNSDWRVLRNGHTVAQASAIGIAAHVLNQESHGDTTHLNEVDSWIIDVDAVMLAVLGTLDDDGSSNNGTTYWEVELDYLLRYIEAARQNPDHTDSGRPFTPTADLYADHFWLAATPKYLLHTTAPGGQRPLTSDALKSDEWQLPTHTLARLSEEYDSGYDTGGSTLYSSHASLALRLAWDGHNDWTSPRTKTKRDVLDILWWNQGGSVTTNLASTEWKSRRFDDTGLVSVRSSWTDAGAIHLVYRGGPIIGGHDKPDVGTFQIYAGDMLLVGDVGLDEVSSRTANASTIVIDGKGQHADYDALTEAAPEGANNNSRDVTMLDASTLPGASGVPVQVVSFKTDMTQLYRFDEASDNDRDHSSGAVADWVSDVETSGRTLQELSRTVIFIGDPTPFANDDGAGAIFVYDRFQSTITSGSPFRFDWRLQTADTAGSGTFGDRNTCDIPSTTSGGVEYFQWEDATQSVLNLRLDWVTAGRHHTEVTCTTACSSIRTEIAKGDRWPVDTGCTIPDGTALSTFATYEASSSEYSLYVRPIDASSVTWAWKPTAAYDGGTIVGRHLLRTTTGLQDGMLVHALMPMDDLSVSTLTTYSGETGGEKVKVDILTNAAGSTSAGYTATLLFGSPTSTSVVSGTDTSTADVGVIMRDRTSTNTLYGAQMVQGSKLEASIGGTNRVLLQATYNFGTPTRINASVLHASNYSVLCVDDTLAVSPSTYAKVDVYVPNLTASNAIVHRWTGDGSQFTSKSGVSGSGNNVSITALQPGKYVIRDSTSTALPNIDQLPCGA